MQFLRIFHVGKFSMKKNIKNRWIALVILCCAMGSLVYFKNTRIKPLQTKALNYSKYVDILPVIKDLYQVELTLLALTEARYESQLKATVNATVKKIWVYPGTEVKKGQTLISLDKSRIQLQVQQYKASVENIKAKIRLDKIQFKFAKEILEEQKILQNLNNLSLQRVVRLQKSKVLSEEKLEQIQITFHQSTIQLYQQQQRVKEYPLRLQQLQAELLKAQAIYQNSLKDLQETEIVAPYSGYVTDIMVAPGERVHDGNPLLGVYAKKNIELSAIVPQQYLKTIMQAMQKGEVVKAKIVQGAEQILLHAVRIAAKRQVKELGRKLYFSLIQGNNQLIIPGQQFTIQLFLPAQKDLIAIPLSALYQQQYVYKVQVNKNQQAVLQRIAVTYHGQQQSDNNRSKALISAKGLQVGDYILNTYLPDAASGLRVMIKEQTNAT